jgi:hypothetical protein
MQISDKSNFQISLQQDNGDNLSEYWQDQCKYLYDELYRTLPGSSIKPLTLKGSTGEKAVEIILFSTILIEVASKFCAHTILEILNNWYEHRQNTSIKITCPDGSIVDIPRQIIPNLPKFSSENPHLSICEAIDRLINTTK